VNQLNESILIIDDDTHVRKTLSSILLDEGYCVETVENGKQAIRALEKAYFDLALVDIELPDMKGTELLLRLKEKQPKMAKIIITGFPSLENAIKAVNEGANGYILKPFDAEELLKIIRKQLDEKAAEQLRTWIEKSEMEQRNTVFSEQFKKSKGSLFSR
jgi:DNA-binding NtrC family response regulator